MSILESTISAALLPDLNGVTSHEKWLNCAIEYPWYPLPWLMLAKEDENGFLQKANLFFADEQRLHWLLHAGQIQQDEWLQKNLPLALENNTYLSEKEEFIRISESDIIGNNEPDFALKSGLNTEITTETYLETSEPNNAGEETTQNYDIQHITSNSIQKTLHKIALSTVESKEGKIDLDGPVSGENSPVEKPPVVLTEPLAEQSASPLAFEPFHVVDYFASQGIKLDLNAEPKDKFDRQLKSFTQWLKTMKKVTLHETPASVDPLVDTQANQSNSGEIIITEAMALVLEKQGKYEKAANIYEKLILLHPEKSVFFAAQIEDLKNKQ